MGLVTEEDERADPERAGFRLGTATASGTTDVAVLIENLRLAYGDRKALEVDRLEIPTGRITAVIGPNGSGKSSLLDAIAGLLPPRAGRLEVRTAGTNARRERVGYVLQHTTSDEVVPLTVREVVRMGRYPRRGLLRPLTADDRAAVEEALDRLSIRHLARRQLSELSGGEQQRVFVAQALAQRARLLLLDEPAAALDLPTQERIAEVLLAERHSGNTVVYTTHSVAVAAEADWVVLLAGRLVAAGTPGQVLTDARLSEAYGDRLITEGRAARGA